MMRNRVKLTEDERRKFDDIGLDEINQLTDMPSLQKLMQYMEYVPDSSHHCYFFLLAYFSFALSSLVVPTTTDRQQLFSRSKTCVTLRHHMGMYIIFSQGRVMTTDRRDMYRPRGKPHGASAATLPSSRDHEAAKPPTPPFVFVTPSCQTLR